jgi:hypothetical protein
MRNGTYILSDMLLRPAAKALRRASRLTPEAISYHFNDDDKEKKP